MLRSFPHYQQLDSMDCGPSCLRMIAKFYGRVYSIQNLREKAFITREGVSMLGISEAAEAIGFRTQGVRITVEELEKECPLPCILHWNQWHFVVCYKIKKGEVLHSGPGGGTYHLYEGGVQAVLGQHQGGRTGYRDGALAGTGAGVLRDGGRGERQET